MVIPLLILFNQIISLTGILFNLNPHHDYENPIWPRNWQLFHLQKMDYDPDHERNQTLHSKHEGSEERQILQLPRTRKHFLFVAKRFDKSAPEQHNEKEEKDNKFRVYDSADESFPYQYNIEIRKRQKDTLPDEAPEPTGPVHYMAAATEDREGVSEGRDKHLDRDLELNKYRMLESKEEEHWHDKKWHKEDQKEEYLSGKPVSVKVEVRPKYRDQAAEEKDAANASRIPFYARPLDPHASREDMDKHFSVPSTRIPSRQNIRILGQEGFEIK